MMDIITSKIWFDMGFFLGYATTQIAMNSFAFGAKHPIISTAQSGFTGLVASLA
jgi:hypothetical protein